MTFVQPDRIPDAATDFGADHRIASKLFAAQINRDDVVGETLERRTDEMESALTIRSKLAAAIEAGVNDDAADSEFRVNPLSIWAETTLGIVQEVDDGRWIRATPRRLSDAAEMLAGDSGIDRDKCQKVLERLFLVASRTERARVGSGSDAPFFGVRLHQFISGAGRAHATIEPPGTRKVALDAQKFLPEGDGDKRLYALHFCHNCGQEHMLVWYCDDVDGKRLEARAIDDLPLENDEETTRRFGFFMPVPFGGVDFTGADEDYPETWTERRRNGELRVKATHRKFKHELIYVRPTGEVTSANGIEGWFQPKNFRLCAACGELTNSKGADIYRVAGLSAEGRSSATTILVASILKWMNGNEAGISDLLKRKVLGFAEPS